MSRPGLKFLEIFDEDGLYTCSEFDIGICFEVCHERLFVVEYQHVYDAAPLRVEAPAHKVFFENTYYYITPGNIAALFPTEVKP